MKLQITYSQYAETSSMFVLLLFEASSIMDLFSVRSNRICIVVNSLLLNDNYADEMFRKKLGQNPDKQNDISLLLYLYKTVHVLLPALYSYHWFIGYYT